MNTHPHGEQISAYVDGMLDLARLRDVASHLRGCAACRTSAEEMRKVKGLLRGLGNPAPPSSAFWTDSYRQLRAADHAQAASLGFDWSSLTGLGKSPSRRWAAGAAALVALGAVIATPFYHVTETSLPPPVAAVAQDSSPDVASLVQAHTDSVARLPLADPDRQKMIAADAGLSGMPEAAGDADSAY